MKKNCNFQLREESLYPKISIVTPCFNQSRFIEETIFSVLSQNYPNLEYVIIDGGSTDGSVDIIKKFETQLAYWVTEPDSGQYDAINKGFSKTTGEIMAWINSDDLYTPWAFRVVGEIFFRFPEVEWVTTLFRLILDEKGTATECSKIKGFNREEFFRGENLPVNGCSKRGVIQQESTFWRRSLWERVGGYVDASLEYAGDFELWARFFQFAELYAVGTPIGGFRVHENQKTAKSPEGYSREAMDVLLKFGGRIPGKFENLFRSAFFDRLPERLRRSLKVFGWDSPKMFCIHSERNIGWKIFTV